MKHLKKKTIPPTNASKTVKYLEIIFCVSFQGHAQGYRSSQATGWIRYSYQPTPQPRQHWILNPLSEARNWTCVLMDASQIRFCWATMGTPELAYLFNFLWIPESNDLVGWKHQRVMLIYVCCYPFAACFEDWFFSYYVVMTLS